VFNIVENNTWLILDKYVVNLDGYYDGCWLVNSVVIPFNFSQNGICVIFFILYPFQPWYLYSYLYDKENPFAWYALIPGIFEIDRISLFTIYKIAFDNF